MKKYQTIGIGGSFDHFHLGHQTFIKFAAELAETVLIGVTSQELTANKPFADTIEPYEVRKQAVETFCQQEGISYQLVQITDVYGPTLDDGVVQALGATNETKAGVDMINTIRVKRGLAELPVHFCPLVPAEDGQEIHSVRIRAGEINRVGQVYTQLFKHDLEISSEQRQVLSQPQGQVVFPNHDFQQTDLPNSVLRCVVGDNSLEAFITKQWEYHLGIYDQKRQRKKVASEVIDRLKPDETVDNQPGFISVQLIEALQNCLDHHCKHILINGEEDLAAVALVLLLPLQSEIFYGQPHQGIVRLTVTEELKNHIYSLLSA